MRPLVLGEERNAVSMLVQAQIISQGIDLIRTETHLSEVSEKSRVDIPLDRSSKERAGLPCFQK